MMENEKNTVEEKPVKVSSKRIKKAERREAKAARKAANIKEDKSSRPNNGLIAILIFGVVIAMFAFVLCYNYFSKPATIEKYIEKNGGADTYGSMQIDEYTTANITAKGNSMNIEMTVDDSEELIAEMVKEFYTGEDGEDQVKDIAAYFITNMKPQTRAFSADVKATVKLGKEELQSVKMTYKEAKDFLKEEADKAKEQAEEAQKEEKAEEEADDAAEEAEEEADEDADDASEDAEKSEEDAAEEAAEDVEEAAEDAAEDAEKASEKSSKKSSKKSSEKTSDDE